MQPAVDQWTRHSYMLAAIKEGFPRLRESTTLREDVLSIVCYGPSLQDTWQQITRPMATVSGALKFLAARGIVPDYHIAMDPRAEAVQHVTPPVPGVHYLMASVCHPKTWTVLMGQQVTLWHAVSHKGITAEWIERMDPGQMVLHMGSHVGLGALHVGGMLGFRKFEIHGMDGSVRDNQRHAGPHPGKSQRHDITWRVHNVTYQTSKIMANGVQEVMGALENYPILCIFHGDGLTQALIRKRQYPNACCADETEKADLLRTAGIELVAV
jgi:hypothetical protein